MKLSAVAAIVLGLTGLSFADSAPAATKAAEVKVGNTKCIVTGEDMMESGATVSHNGKTYNLCCAGCADDFKKDPAKFVKALEADPAKYGVKKEEKTAK